MDQRNKNSTVITKFWCHFCQIFFNSDLKPGKDDILCPICDNEFCQIKSGFTSPQQFKPYQKSPYKKQHSTKKVSRQYLTMTINELAQILQIKESQNFLITEEMLQKLRKQVQERSQCSVCRVELEVGEKGLIPDCRHTFHEQCLLQWIKRKNTCPSCRQKIVKEAIQN